MRENPDRDIDESYFMNQLYMVYQISSIVEISYGKHIGDKEDLEKVGSLSEITGSYIRTIDAPDFVTDNTFHNYLINALEITENFLSLVREQRD